jgi:ABC-type nitrate/sulfonate/bicarbonate transport system substrate-binding protein
LNDAAPLIVAADRGFFAAQGVEVALSREASWATVREKLVVGALDGAHLLAPMALAATLGVGGEAAPMIAPLALNMNGPVVTLSARLAALAGTGPDAAGLAALVARRRAEGASPLTFAVVFPYSAHNYVLRAWMAEAGIDPDQDVRLTVVPPPRMAELLAGGVIEGFCAGEPWSAAAVATGAGQVALRTPQWREATPDKVFGVMQAWADGHPSELAAILRALSAAGAWAQDPENRAALVALLARPEHLGVAGELIAAGLSAAVFPRDGVAAPQPDDAAWLLKQMIRWGQAPDGLDIAAVSARVYRPDLLSAS